MSEPITLDRLLLRDFDPRPAMRARHAGPPERPRYPAIDAHNHLGGAFTAFAGAWATRPVEDLFAVLDAAGVERLVALDGTFGESFRVEVERLRIGRHNRIALFCGIDMANVAVDPRFGETEARRLRESAALGAQGLKIWKPLGLTLRDHRGHLVPVDDERLDPLWGAAADLGLPVLIHVADPVAFFGPVDRHNERIEELAEHPDWHFHPTRPAPDPADPRFPTFDEIMAQFRSLLLRHPRTTFIGAHVGCNAEDLHWVGETLAMCPNFFVDPSARMAELGRQPYTARDFFIQWQDRVLFGTDSPPDVDTYRLWYRFLETRDEYFPYWPEGEMPGQGRWHVHALDLPDDVLRKVYRTNALRVVWGETDETTSAPARSGRETGNGTEGP